MVSHKLRALVVATAAAVGLSVAGVSSASAAPLPGPNGVLAPPIPHGLVGPTSPPVDGGLDPGDRVTSKVNGLRVRSGPGTGYGVLGQLYSGDTGWAVGYRREAPAPGWVKVKLSRPSAGGLPKSFTGWVSQPYLKW